VAGLKDLSGREALVLGVLAFAVLGMGIWPLPFTEVLHTSVNDLVTHVTQSKLPAR
jgi:NADH-quinone oxidoreductase subunit M